MFLNNRIADKISTFRASLADLPSLPPPTPSCPNNSKTDDFVKHYSFGIDRRVPDADEQVVVHHGRLPHDKAKRFMLLYEAVPTVFAHASVERLIVTPDQVGQILDGRINDWSQLGRGQRPIRLFCHGGSVQMSVLETVAVELFGASGLDCDVTGCRDYHDLAARACADTSSIVFGLRPAFATRELSLVAIDGPNRSLPVWLSVSRTCNVFELEAWLNNVKQRVEADASALARLATSEPLQSAA